MVLPNTDSQKQFFAKGFPKLSLYFVSSSWKQLGDMAAASGHGWPMVFGLVRPMTQTHGQPYGHGVVASKCHINVNGPAGRGLPRAGQWFWPVPGPTNRVFQAHECHAMNIGSVAALPTIVFWLQKKMPNPSGCLSSASPCAPASTLRIFDLRAPLGIF